MSVGSEINFALSAYMQVEAFVSGSNHVVEGSLDVFVLRENVLQ